MKDYKMKYHNTKCEYGGIRFDSKKEMAYYQTLLLLMKAKDNPVIDIQLQVPFEVEINGIKICKYYADFVVKYLNWDIQVIDVKGCKTPVYRLKKKMVEAQFGIKIIEK